MLKLDQVSKVYRVGTFGTIPLTAVREVDIEVPAGTVVSLIGESGSGKSTIGRMVLRLTSVSSGHITFDGQDLARMRGHKARKEYYRKVQGVFQDPFSCFNPIFTVDRVFDMLRGEYFAGLSDHDWRAKVHGGIERVSLDPGQVLGRFPHQLSGGQLQRLLIARALMLDIKLLVADEIISMLDASTRIDVLNLLGDLRAEGLGILFVTHDLALGTYVSDTTVILRHGAIAEMGPTGTVFAAPRHPYTRGLLASVPQLHRTWAEMDAELERDSASSSLPPAASGSGLTEVGPGHFIGEHGIGQHSVGPIDEDTPAGAA